MNTAWESPLGHRAISFEENLTFILSVFFRENLSFLYGKSFVQTQLFSSLFSLFYHPSVHIISVLYRILLLFGRSGDGVVV